MICDQQGNWNRFKNRLRLNNLHFYGSKVPSANAARDTVTEQILSLQCEGADPDFILEKPLGYAEQMAVLEGKGLVEPLPLKAPKKTSNISLIKNHRKKVQ